MDFSPQQAKAIDEVGAWLKAPGRQTFYLAGYAGTGKTTLAKYLAETAGNTLFAAYTGKAASVLNRKGCNASTIHGLIYRLVPPNVAAMREIMHQLKVAGSANRIAELKAELAKLNKPKFILNEESLIHDCDLVVIDEVSMVGQQIGADLLSFGKKVLVLGDPGQLPPVEGGGYFTSREPDFLLTEVHRQAQGSPIINMATVVRQGGRLSYGAYGDCIVQHRDNTMPDQLLMADQVIVGLNRTRKELNATIRDALDRTGAVPVPNDKLICLKNNHELGLLNGTQWSVERSEDMGTHYELDLWPLDPPTPPDKPQNIQCHPFGTNFAELPWYQRKNYDEFDFGYAITCHKSQGSQWPFIFIQNESYAFREDKAKWLYTALTRAENKVLVAM